MTGCECKSGFFTLRDCDGAPAGSCSECGRTACTRHLSPASGFTQCLDCHARAGQAAGAKPAAGEPALDDEWTYGARHRFYSPFAQWQPVLAVPGATFVNLQYGDCAAELEAAVAKASKK